MNRPTPYRRRGRHRQTGSDTAPSIDTHPTTRPVVRPAAAARNGDRPESQHPDDAAPPAVHDIAVTGLPEPSPSGTTAHRRTPRARPSVHVRRPVPGVVVVCPSGVLDNRALHLLARHIDATATGIRHAVVDLRAVAPVTAGGARGLIDLDQHCTCHGTMLHLAGTETHPLLLGPVADGLLRGAGSGTIRTGRHTAARRRRW